MKDKQKKQAPEEPPKPKKSDAWSMGADIVDLGNLNTGLPADSDAPEFLQKKSKESQPLNSKADYRAPMLSSGF